MSQFQFLLASRRIPVHYGLVEFEEDLQTLQEMDRIVDHKGDKRHSLKTFGYLMLEKSLSSSCDLEP